MKKIKSNLVNERWSVNKKNELSKIIIKEINKR